MREFAPRATPASLNDLGSTGHFYWIPYPPPLLSGGVSIVAGGLAQPADTFRATADAYTAASSSCLCLGDDLDRPAAEWRHWAPPRILAREAARELERQRILDELARRREEPLASACP